MHGVICILCLNLSYCTVRSWAQTKIAMWNNLATLGLSCVITVLSMLVNAGGRSPPADLIQHKQTEAPLASRVTYLQHAHSPVHAGRFRRQIPPFAPPTSSRSPSLPPPSLYPSPHASLSLLFPFRFSPHSPCLWPYARVCARARALAWACALARECANWPRCVRLGGGARIALPIVASARVRAENKRARCSGWRCDSAQPRSRPKPMKESSAPPTTQDPDLKCEELHRWRRRSRPSADHGQGLVCSFRVS